MTINFELLRSLTQAPGIPSREDQIRRVVAEELAPLVDEIAVDRMGNLTGTLRGAGGPIVAIAAHIDEIGFLVRHIDENGFLRLQQVGGFDPRTLVAQRVLVHPESGTPLPGVLQPGTRPIHLQKPGDAKDLRVDDLFVDLGLPAEQVHDHISVGDMVTMDRDLQIVGDTVVSKALDDRLGVFVMLEAMRSLGPAAATVVAVATTQEEVGLRGARTSAFNVEADIVIALDVTIAGDIPGNAADAQVTKLGGGAGIKVYDSSQLPNVAINRHLRDLAVERGIPHQLEVLPAGGTDAAAYQQARGGAFTSTISIPTRYVHTVNEMANIGDIQACIDLLVAFVKSAGTREYGFALSPDLVTRAQV
jgi:endoglucanase